MPKQAAPQELATIAPKLVELTDEVLFADVWERPGLSPRDRSLVTVSVLASSTAPSSSATTWAWPWTTA